MSLPEHCSSCWYFLYKMGSCPYPGVSLVYSVLSTMPYMAAFALGLLALVKRRLSLFGAFFIVASCYLLTDGYIKKIVQDPRPPGACKKSYGMPSSHMVVTGCLAVLILKNDPMGWYIAIAISLLQGLARYKLHYHTPIQIVIGYIFGVVYCVIAIRILRMLHVRYKGLIRRVPYVKDDMELPIDVTQHSS